jgi:hypothetical protein
MFAEPREPLETKKEPPKETPRKVRSDKTTSIKFPVTEEERRELRLAAMIAGLGEKQTMYNTSLLLKTLSDAARIPPITYKDTGQYMTVNPVQEANERIVQLMLQWGTSKREAVHRLIISALRRGVR